MDLFLDKWLPLRGWSVDSCLSFFRGGTPVKSIGEGLRLRSSFFRSLTLPFLTEAFSLDFLVKWETSLDKEVSFSPLDTLPSANIELESGWEWGLVLPLWSMGSDTGSEASKLVGCLLPD